MILYFDNLITDEPLIKGLYNESTERRKKTASNYKLPSRLDVALYSLSSYAHIKWSSVIIKYDLADKSKINYFESFVKSIFPNAIIIRGRSDTQQKFQETIKLLETLADPWVFYVGNVDHPIIYPSKDALEKLSRKLFSLDNKFTPISAYISHCFEVLSICEKNSVVYYPNWKKIE